VSESIVVDGVTSQQYSLLEAKFHYGWWSLLPALVAIVLCLLTKEPLTALAGGIVVGAFMLGKFDITDDVLVPNLASTGSASILLLYLWLLGGLLGIWSKTGAAQAFADFMAKNFIKGPRSAKLVAWLLGVVFFQGGTVSTVLVGTTVRPLADQNNISHEEMSYIVDSTASPIAALLAFNAWPAYVQALIFVPGAAFLATEADRISFFFSSIPFSFYAIFAIIGTLLLSLDITHISGKGMRKAVKRARETGELDAPGAKPLSAKELQTTQVPEGYAPHVLEFFVPLGLIIGIAVGTFMALGVPKVNWAFGSAVLACCVIAIVRGMSLDHILDGIGNGLKGVVVASVILMLAITVGAISKEVGGGLFLVELLGQKIPFWALPVCLQLITMATAFSTGTSWGTYAIAFPLAMPLAWAVAESQGLQNPEIFMAICFATVLNGSVYGDQCSPISDTTVISSMTTGCDLVDHVKTQLIPASIAAFIAAILWTLSALFLA
jgi:Na+/H+ antiporter NhaC